MKIGELSRRTGVPTRMLRYYEEQDLLHPERADNGYRSYDEPAVHRVQQIRGLLDSGLTTEIIRRILPFLDKPDEIHLHPECLTPETAALLRGEAERIQQRIDCLARNRDAIHAYLAAVLSASEASSPSPAAPAPTPGRSGATSGEPVPAEAPPT
ncbi:MerR family transcriptional regulator [Streptomyces sp. NPDC059743]|uniref:MerR family transcriptional regulator n=1 Tax=Streptomyces sp. NPDC059743 TaxID=3346928 RepID=UPI003663A384